MKLKDLFEGDILAFPSSGKRELDALLKIKPSNTKEERELFVKLETFIMDDKHPMALRLKALQKITEITGERSEKFTTKDVEDWAEFAKQTHDMASQITQRAK
ncbi:MAG: hypothetical protein ACREAU_00525 [Nitrosopumilaceae archaeon]